MPGIDTAVFTLRGLLAHYFHSSERAEWKDGSGPFIMPALWCPPEFEESMRKIRLVKDRIGSSDFHRAGMAVFVRPLGDLDGLDFSFDSSSLYGFLDAVERQQVPVFFNLSGSQWTEVAYKKSPLIQALMEDPNKRVWLKGNKPVPRNRQPGFQDWNGLSYLCWKNPVVEWYWDRNLSQTAKAIAAFYQKHPDLVVGVCTPNETDLPGLWSGRGLDSDYNPAFQKAYLESGILDWQQFRIHAVRERIAKDAKIIADAGIPGEKIYTHISTEDANRRASPFEVGIVPDAGNIGLAWWGGHFGLEDITAWGEKAAASGKGVGLLAANTRSTDQAFSEAFFRTAFKAGANPIVLYCWDPFVGYGVIGMPMEAAARNFGKF